MASTAPVTRAVELDRIEALAALQGSRLEHVQLAPGRFRFSLREADFGLLQMRSNRVAGSYLARGDMRAEVWTLFYTTGGPSGASRLNGIPLGSDDAVLYGPGAELHARVADAQGWGALSLKAAAVRDVFDAVPAARAGQVVKLPGLVARAPGLLRLADLVRRGVPGGSGIAVSDAVVDDLRAALDGALAGGAPRRRADRRTVRVTSAAVEFLAAAQGRPVYSTEIGAALGVSPRFVNHCFDAVYGISVQRYLRLRRLAEARQRLMAGGAGLLVKQVALDFGFWHFGRFARAYQAQFGEMPSQTLAADGRRALGEGPGRLSDRERRRSDVRSSAPRRAA